MKKARSILNDGYEYAVGIDLERFFDTVNQSYLIELLSHTVKDGRVISLIHKYLYAGVMIDGVYHPTPEGTPQGGPLSPLLSNIVLNELDKELEKRGHPFVRYADAYECAYGRAGRNQGHASGILSNVASHSGEPIGTGIAVKDTGLMQEG